MNRFLTLLLLIAPALVFAQTTRRITGQVLVRATGEPLVGATVFIAPEETRSVLIQALDMLASKRVSRLSKKHGNLPY